jgi:hypothetical protein
MNIRTRDPDSEFVHASHGPMKQVVKTMYIATMQETGVRANKRRMRMYTKLHVR